MPVHEILTDLTLHPILTCTWSLFDLIVPREKVQSVSCEGDCSMETHASSNARGLYDFKRDKPSSDKSASQQRITTASGGPICVQSP